MLVASASACGLKPAAPVIVLFMLLSAWIVLVTASRATPAPRRFGREAVAW